MPTDNRLRLAREASDLWALDDAERKIRFLPSVFTQVSLPYRDPGDDRRFWSRRNGDLALFVTPGPTIDPETGIEASLGFPYGTVPRLLLAYLSTEALRTGKREVPLGASLTSFMRSLGMSATGGRNGSITRVRNQMNRLFGASISVQYHGHANSDVGRHWTVASQYRLWWMEGDGTTALADSVVRLSQEFYDEVCSRPVPLDLGALAALRGSAQRLDLYAWLTYRMSYLSAPSLVSWESLRQQFGASHQPTAEGRKQFKKDFVRHLTEVLAVYGADVEVTVRGLLLRPSRPHVPFRGTGPSRRAVHTTA